MRVSRSGTPVPLSKQGQRVTIRTLEPSNYDQWIEIRQRCRDWLLPWEPRPAGATFPPEDRHSFASRCALRERERQMGGGFGFGIFVGDVFVGELTLSSVVRGPFQNAVIGYWIDSAQAGNGYVPEAVAVALAFAFDDLGLHRIEIAIIPRNERSRRVVEKLNIRLEGVAEKFLQINGVWEDHARFAITAEEWRARRDEFLDRWILPVL